MAAVPTTAGRAATKGWVLFIASTRVRKKSGRSKHKDNTLNTTRRVKPRSAAAPELVAGLLLWERADSKRLGWLERMRNERMLGG